MRQPRSLILEVSVDLVFPVAMLLSLFLLFAGHNAPGGGFVGGLVAGAALVLRHIRGGSPDIARVVPVSWPVVTGAGLVVATLTGVAGYVVGDAFLESGKLSVKAPVLGTVKASTSLAFDVGVYLVVVGLVLAALQTLGQEEPE